MKKIKEKKITEFSEYLRENYQAHIICINDKKNTLVSCACSPEDMYYFLLGIVEGVPQLKDAIISAAEELKDRRSIITNKPEYLN